jgi:glutaminyl-tRNA synthetase
MTNQDKHTENSTESSASTNFIRYIVEEDLQAGKNDGRVHTRFPPEPNGYLHIGHAKSICLNFGLARDYKGMCNLRYDDTDPSKESIEYVDSIKEDVRWLGFDWEEREYYASNYFEQLFEYAVQLIKAGKAYVDSGEFKDGEHVLRAKIDMAAPNIILRDPTLYRIRHVSHYRTGNMWCIYPMYDFTHCLSLGAR